MNKSAQNNIEISTFADSMTSIAFVIDSENTPIYANIAFKLKYKVNNDSELTELIQNVQTDDANQGYVTIRNENFKCNKLEFIVKKTSYHLIVIVAPLKLIDNLNFLGNAEVLDAIPDILSIHDTKNNVIYYNKAGYEFLQKSQDDVVGKKCFMLIGRNQECVDCPARESIKSGRAVQTMKHFPNLGKWFDIRAYPIKNADNVVVQVIEHLRDITSQKLNEIKLNESEEKHRILIENVPGIVYQCKIDINWTMLFMSQETKDITGYAPEDFLQSNNIAFAEIIHPDDRELVRRVIAESIAVNNNFIVEYRIITKDDQIKYVWKKGKAVVTDQRKYIDGVILDITNRKTAEIELAISENKYRLLVENQNELVVKVDRHGRFTYVNDTYCKVFGKTEQELLNKNFMPLVHEDDKEATNLALSKLSSYPHTCYIEQRAMTEQGWRWLAWSDRAILNEKKDIIEIIAVGRDITEQKSMEFELIKAKKRAECSEMAKIDFVINAHKIVKESLFPIADLAKSMTEINVINYKNTNHHKILFNTLVLEGLIDGFSDISLFEQDKIRIRPEKFDIKALFEEMHSLINSAYYNDDIDIIFKNSDSGDYIIYSDRGKIKYIILHLFQIAIKQNKDRVIFIGFEIVNDYVKLFVNYVGDKIDLKNAYLIDSSRRGQSCENLNAMTYPELTITKLYSDYLEGNMKTESKTDRVQLEVEIPITKLSSKFFERDSKQGNSPDLSGLTILVAEDERINFHLMKTILTKAGATVKRAVSGNEAIQIVETDKTISLVFMDIKMPGVGGVEALQKIKTINPNLPVIACTAFTQSEDLESIKKAQFDDFLPKPIRRQDLFAIIDNVRHR